MAQYDQQDLIQHGKSLSANAYTLQSVTETALYKEYGDDRVFNHTYK
jgi:hypothetical protein